MPLNALRRRYSSGLHELNLERDGNLVANEDAAGLQRGVPRQAKVFTVDLCAGREPHAGFSPRIFARRGWSFNVEYHVAGDAVDGQVARHSQFPVADSVYARRWEGQRRKLLHVEKVGALEMCIPLGITSVDRSRVDRHLDAGVG